MDVFEVQDVLKSFRIIVDSREHMTPRAAERFSSLSVPVERGTLDYGDYCGNIILPDGKPLYRTKGRIRPACVIERKMSLDELAGCFGRDRGRFQREFERAGANGARVYLLVENASFEGIINHRYRSRFNPSAFLASLTAWTVRYGITPVMCRSGTSGTIIREILYRDMKERLEKGEYG